MLLNAFSLNMIHAFPASVTCTEISAANARSLLMLWAEDQGESEFIRSAVGHADTAEVFGSVLGLPVPCRRETVTLSSGDSVVVGQYSGPRLPEGATELPEGATIKWLLVNVD